MAGDSTSVKHDRQTIYDTLRNEISVGKLKPGEVLKEVALSDRFGVSRTPVRDALQRLTADEMLERTNRGLQVKRVDADRVVEVYEMRILLEEEAAGRAAQRQTISEILQLETLLERDKNLVDPDDETKMRTNLEFHEVIWQATHTPVLIDLLHRLSEHLIHAPRSTLSEPGRWETSLAEHEYLLSAIKDRRVDDARAMARKHFEEARAIRLRILREEVASQTLGDH